MDSTIIAYFVTDHGFGHASRSAAVMAALAEMAPGIRFEIFTTCPRWIFDQTFESASVHASWAFHRIKTDVGLVQSSPLEEDLPETCRALNQWLPLDGDLIDELAGRLVDLRCRLVVCDISPLGIVAARKAALPSVLVENFTWDWIYGHYAKDFPPMAAAARILNQIYGQVDLRIQTEPLCHALNHGLKVNPIARWPHFDGAETRNRLGISDTEKMVVVSMGGVVDRFAFLHSLPDQLDFFIVVPGADGLESAHPRVLLLPTHSAHYHPDLIHTADALVGKAGYSTIAEAFQAGLPYGYILRHNFPESVHLEQFISAHMQGMAISSRDYHSGQWLENLPFLLSLSSRSPVAENGAFQTARMLLNQCQG